MKYRLVKNQLRSDWFSQLPDDAFIREAQIVVSHKTTAPLVGVSASTWWRWVRAGIAPRPVKFSAGTTAWKVGDLRDFLKSVSAGEQR
jgi:predicted DNA-binding transcriptional regulator AlpA